MVLSPRFDQALVYAADLHRQQLRKGSPIPYLTHLLGVASLVFSHGGDEELGIAALLHDSLEDGPEYSGRSWEEIEAQIREQFGERVLQIVLDCTDTDSTGQKESWQQRKSRYLQRMAQSRDPGYLLVTTCDKLHNLHAIWLDRQMVGEGIWQRFTAPKAATLWYYQEIGRIVQQQAQAGQIPKVLSQQYQILLQSLLATALVTS
ncbi:MAG: HD domain-containing protein [Thermostichales cyanobacterium BF4_bins_65]